MIKFNIKRFQSLLVTGYQPKLQNKQLERPFETIFKKFHHLTFYCFNGLHTANFYKNLFNLDICYYSGPENGLKDKNIYILNNGNLTIELISPVYDNPEIYDFLLKHGDTMKSCTIEVENLKELKNNLTKNKTRFFENQYKDNNGIVNEIEVPMFNYISHKFVEKINYKGDFLPNYNLKFNKNKNDYLKLDHIGFPQNENEMKKVCDFYFKNFNFHHFWSVDDKIVHSDVSALNSTVVSDFDENIKFPIFEPIHKIKKSQILEFLEYNNGPGAQHIALEVNNIIEIVEKLKDIGLQFLEVPNSYYEIVEQKLKENNIKIKESMDFLKKNKILLDFDKEGYLLQIFTKPITNKPTLFYEFIQRENNQGFGVGNFRRLFLSIEEEQKKRGNLI